MGPFSTTLGTKHPLLRGFMFVQVKDNALLQREIITNSKYTLKDYALFQGDIIIGTVFQMSDVLLCQHHSKSTISDVYLAFFSDFEIFGGTIS